MKYYCIHHTPAKERKQYILDHYVNKYNIDIIWIEDYLPSSNDVRIPKIFTNHAANKEFLSYAEISCFMKHRDAIKKISQNNECGMILEDDLEKANFDFIPVIYFFEEQITNKFYDILFIGSYGFNDLKDTNMPYIFSNRNTLSRCAHCYVLSPTIAKTIYDFLLNITLPFDHQLNLIISKLNLKSGWTYPHIYQRTEKKQINSLLR